MYNNSDLNFDSPWNRFSSADNERINFSNIIEEKIETDVPGLFSDAVYKKGMDEFPIFDVAENEFNMNEDFRNKLRFTGGAGEYIEKTRIKRPFYVRCTDNSFGKTFVKKIQ